MGKNYEEKQRELIKLSDTIEPDSKIGTVREIHEKFVEFIKENPTTQLLPKFKEELKFIEDTIKEYESSRNDKNSKPNYSYSVNLPNPILEDKDQANCSISVNALKNSGDKILQTLSVNVPKDNFINKIIINISSNLTSCMNATISIFNQNNKVNVKTTSEESSLMNDFVMLPSHSCDTDISNKNIVIEVTVGGEL